MKKQLTLKSMINRLASGFVGFSFLAIALFQIDREDNAKDRNVYPIFALVIFAGICFYGLYKLYQDRKKFKEEEN